MLDSLTIIFLRVSVLQNAAQCFLDSFGKNSYRLLPGFLPKLSVLLIEDIPPCFSLTVHFIYGHCSCFSETFYYTMLKLPGR